MKTLFVLLAAGALISYFGPYLLEIFGMLVLMAIVVVASVVLQIGILCFLDGMTRR